MSAGTNGAVAERGEHWHLCLYVSGQSVKSMNASVNLARLCEKHLQGRYSIETIDLSTDPKFARSDDILVVPTLIRRFPAPVRKLIGDLSNTERVLVELNLASF
jgi:circadian clock protein KaiB